MLRLARHLRGLTQKKTAEQLGVAQAVYSRMENDLVEVDDECIRVASRAFNLPPGFFDLPDTVYGPPVSIHPMLRGHSDVTARELDMITAELNVRMFNLRRFLEEMDLKPSLDLRRFDLEQYGSPADIADLLRRHWKIPSGPIKNLTRLVERAGVVVGYSDFGGANVSGVTFAVPGRPPLVLLNPSHPADRVRFTLAHELGHLVMHRFPTPNMEEEANLFASNFLLPRKELNDALRGRKVTLALLAALKPEWRVSMQGILYAIQREKIITPNQARYLWQQIATRGWKTREPANLDFEHDRPTVLPTIIKAMRQELGLSGEDIKSITQIYSEEFDRFYPYASEAGTRPMLRIVS
ncbi:ImmA/IrrE family metallo-endopeptidase [Rhodobacter sphaeroides]|jgi:Zn-dependent peptidase ImmA (M78 family)|uniref:DNA-binding protein n=2 Tax=Cereibacter sphaeroides TaxID=1063 RepID=Q3J616_CERS4|nr:XRE family transcriptional regulator [Cereibacter sphaeroides]ABA77768.1 Putative DNA-binding protein [Cereibacter sphaeroides 2.4.1]AXC60011.1 ImmA/IrrE family metallo-endopeptidase [Cereibacter sphaeroides 2.4.1]MVX48979.1 ImmA/IrrE family metallo-endopeptidase [Cereibacter sphaeroides]